MEPSHAVFLSYASQDSAAAQRICEALRTAGVEVWFDQSELRGGDAWDQSIRRQIKSCALFIPVISQHTQERVEGYFRLEWKLAVDRSHLIMPNRPFLLPIVIDDADDDDENVPDKFREVQWIRLPGGDATPSFVGRVQSLLSGEASTASWPAAESRSVLLGERPLRSWSLMPALSLAIAALILAAVAYLAIDKPWISKPAAVQSHFNPPLHSIAVLPFANLSGDASQEYFSDGLTEELLNALAQIGGLRVAARASAFSFKGQNADIGTIARKLNVSAVLEGSVQRSGHTVRITAELVDSVAGFDLWSKTYDRDLGDVLKLESEIATAVAGSLRVKLLGGTDARIELGGTSNPAAFDAYLRALRAYNSRREDNEIPNAIAAYTEAIRLDPNFALAYADRSLAFSGFALSSGNGGSYVHAETDARRALELAPQLAQAHLALANVLEQTLNFRQARLEYERALTLAPGAAQVLRFSGEFEGLMGNPDQGLASLRRAVALDPIDRNVYFGLGWTLFYARRYGEALSAYAEALRLASDFKSLYVQRGLALYMLGNLQAARSSCEAATDDTESQWCLAVVYDKLERHADAEAALAQFRSAYGGANAYEYSTIYAQWGDKTKALDWLNVAMRHHDDGLEFLKTDPLLDPVRSEPRFQAIERELKFPN